MSSSNNDPAHSNLASPTDPKTPHIDANLRLAAEKAQPIRLRRLLQQLRHTQPDAHKVTGALLIATQQRYTEKIKASKGTQSDDEEEEEEEDDEDEPDIDGSNDGREISELSSEEEEEEEEEEEYNDSDYDIERSEVSSADEDDGTDEEAASTTTSTQHMPVKSEVRLKD